MDDERVFKVEVEWAGRKGELVQRGHDPAEVPSDIRRVVIAAYMYEHYLSILRSGYDSGYTVQFLIDAKTELESAVHALEQDWHPYFEKKVVEKLNLPNET